MTADREEWQKNTSMNAIWFLCNFVALYWVGKHAILGLEGFSDLIKSLGEYIIIITKILPYSLLWKYIGNKTLNKGKRIWIDMAEDF